MSWIYCRARDFDYWSYDITQWIELDRPSQSIPVEKEGLPVFVRARGTVCASFGDKLYEAEHEAGWLQAWAGAREAVGPPVASAIWTLIWHEVRHSLSHKVPSPLIPDDMQDHATPEVFCFPLPESRMLSLKDTEAYELNLTGLAGARHIAYWDEDAAQWQGTSINCPIPVGPKASVLLVRRQDAFYLRGLGDCLRLLGSQRVPDPPLTLPGSRHSRPEPVRSHSCTNEYEHS